MTGMTARFWTQNSEVSDLREAMEFARPANPVGTAHYTRAVSTRLAAASTNHPSTRCRRGPRMGRRHRLVVIDARRRRGS